MCKVYNTIGCLTTIKSHLHEHNIHEYKSINELIGFQNNYPITRVQIISDHKILIEDEKIILSNEISQLDNLIKEKKDASEQQLILEIERLKHRLDNLSLTQPNIIQTFINYIKKVYLRLKILITTLTFNFKLAHSLKQLTRDYNQKSTRYQYIVSGFESAVMESALPKLRELDRKKIVIDQLNSSIYGALGEQKVVKELEKLSDDYILINDFTCRFNPPIYNRRENDYIRSVQIDHILVSPFGVFLIETKNWSQHSLNNEYLYSPVKQIKRANFALYKILNGETSNVKFLLRKHHWGDRKIQIKNLIVFINHKPVEEFKHVTILTLNRLINYINYFEPCFSNMETQMIANRLLNFPRR